MLNQLRTMTTNISRLFKAAENAEGKLTEVKTWLENLKQVKIEEKIRELTKENELLSSKVEAAKAELIKLEIQNGKKQYPLPGKTSNVTKEIEATTVVLDQAPVKTEAPSVIKKEKKDKDASKKTKDAPKKVTDTINDSIDVRKLDFRIGKIIDINKHPDADSLYVEKIDCGEEKPRTVVSGLVNHVPIEEMKDRIVMVLCNLKPVKMRGVTSEAMVMCASSPDKVEVLIPPPSAIPGDLVSCEGFPREPESILNPKKKIFETCAPDLKTNDDKVACYKGSPLIVEGKGAVVAPTLKGVNVK